MAHKLKEEHDISFLDRMKLRTDNAEKLMNLVYRESERPELAMQAARKLLDDPDVKYDKGRISLPDRLSFAARISESRDGRIANAGLDFIEKNASDEWKTSYECGLLDRFWILRIEDAPARRRAWGIFRDAESRVNPSYTSEGSSGERMNRLLEEVRQAVSLGWKSNPIEFFRNLRVELEKQGIGEKEFAGFLKSEAETALPLIMRQMTATKVSSDPQKKTAKFMRKEGDMAVELLTISRCIERAAEKKMSAEEYFSNMSEEFAGVIVGVSRRQVMEDITKNLVVERKQRKV